MTAARQGRRQVGCRGLHGHDIVGLLHSLTTNWLSVPCWPIMGIPGVPGGKARDEPSSSCRSARPVDGSDTSYSRTARGRVEGRDDLLLVGLSRDEPK